MDASWDQAYYTPDAGASRWCFCKMAGLCRGDVWWPVDKTIGYTGNPGQL